MFVVMAFESTYKESNVPSIGSLVVDERRMS